ncbi:hypothetical protein [Mycolicibacterium lutetiense]
MTVAFIIALTGIGFAQVLLGVVVGVDAGLAGVQEWGWDPFALAALVDAGGPFAGADEALIGTAAEGEFVDVGASAFCPVLVGVVDLGPVRGGGAAGAGTATFTAEQHQPLGQGGGAAVRRVRPR